MKYYAGIGSKETPPDILKVMTFLAIELYRKGYTLRSGGADGADSAFEEGCDQAHKAYLDDSENVYGSLYPQKEIYLPWANFNGRKNGDPGIIYTPILDTWDKAVIMSCKIHPNPDALTRGSRALHARNCYQVLGADLNTPDEFVVCYTHPEYKTGGTRTAVMLAKSYNIPIYNLAIPEVLVDIYRLLDIDDNKTSGG